MDRLRPPDWVHAMQALVPGLVHEFRNPLSGVLAGCQMLQRLTPPSSPTHEYVEIVQDEAKVLEQFLARLAEFGRLGEDELCLTDALDLPSLVCQTLREAKAACEARRILSSTTFDQRAQQVRGDPARLSRALREVVANAVDAMPNGGTLAVQTRLAQPDVHRSAEPSSGRAGGASRREPGHARPNPSADPPADRHPSGAWVEIEVADTGAGMTMEACRRAFEPFFSTRPRALGIGLPLVQAILLAHGGSVQLTSAPEKGTQVCLRLPAAV